MAENVARAEIKGRKHVDIRDGVVLVFSDAHYWPGPRSVGHRALVHFAKKLKPTLVIANGDVLDGCAISRFPAIGWNKLPSVKEELDVCKERLGEVAKAAPHSRRFHLLGNHDARFETRLAFVATLQKNKTDKIWPTEEKGENGSWNLEYIAFFATPLNDSEIQVKFFDITGGEKKYVAGDPQYTREKGSRIFGSSIQLAKPEFDVRKHYMMTVESRGRVLASTTFWLLGKGANYSGKVEFSDAETKAK